MMKNFYPGTHAFLIVYSVERPSSFKSIDNYVVKINNYCNNNPLVYIVGNKCDLESDRRVTF